MKKRVLFITAFAPNDTAAAEKNTKIMLNDLGNHFDVDLIYFKYKADNYYIPENKNVKVIGIYKNALSIKILNILLYPFLHPYFTVRFNWYKVISIKQIIKKQKYDVIIFDLSQVFLYAKYLDTSIPKILLSHDVMAQRVSRNSSKYILKLCTFSERYCLSSVNTQIFSFSQKDCDLISTYYGKSANLCLDYIDEKIIKSNPSNIEDSFIFFGHWGRPDNINGLVWFLENVVPLLINDIYINIIGKSFPMKYLKKLNENIHVTVMDFVENPYPLISNCKAIITPLFTGAGIKVKVIESLACGTPVIGTPIAFEGISTDFSSYMIEANTPEEYVACIEKLEFSIDERKQLKEKFINSYQKETISNYIQNYFQ